MDVSNHSKWCDQVFKALDLYGRGLGLSPDGAILDMFSSALKFIHISFWIWTQACFKWALSFYNKLVYQCFQCTSGHRDVKVWRFELHSDSHSRPYCRPRSLSPRRQVTGRPWLFVLRRPFVPGWMWYGLKNAFFCSAYY